MSLTRKTPAGWFLTSSGELQTDRFGLAQATARWARMDFGNVDPGSPTAFGAAHPLWLFLDCDKVTIRQLDHGWEAEASFFGVNGSPTPIYEVDYSMSEEAIDTHPDFLTTLGGTKRKPLHGANFLPDGTFMGFSQFGNDDAMAAEWRGIRAYLSPGTIWRKNYVTKTRPDDMSDLGRVDVPEGNPPTLSTTRNWLYTGLSWEQRGLTYHAKKEWRASGRRGWNRLVYP